MFLLALEAVSISQNAANILWHITVTSFMEEVTASYTQKSKLTLSGTASNFATSCLRLFHKIFAIRVSCL